MVVIWALWISVSCLRRWALDGSARRRSETALAMRSRIWAAAALVKVTTSRRSMSRGRSPSLIMRTIRSTRTAVLPLPAAAETSILWSRASRTRVCFSVNWIAMIFLLPIDNVQSR